MNLVYVVALIHAKPGLEDEVENVLSSVVPLVRNEAGCIRYDLHRSAGTSPHFMFYEIWASAEALAEHAMAPHMLAMRESLAGLVSEPPTVTTWNAVDIGPVLQ